MSVCTNWLRRLGAFCGEMTRRVNRLLALRRWRPSRRPNRRAALGTSGPGSCSTNCTPAEVYSALLTSETSLCVATLARTHPPLTTHGAMSHEMPHGRSETSAVPHIRQRVKIGRSAGLPQLYVGTASRRLTSCRTVVPWVLLAPADRGRRHADVHRSRPGRGPGSGMNAGQLPKVPGDLSLSSRRSHQTRSPSSMSPSESAEAMCGTAIRAAPRSRPNCSA